jgi:hypothetical protein
MEALIIVERLGRHGDLQERQRLRLQPGQSLRIGRDWDCELHLDDPHVALHHATLSCDDQGAVELRDAGSVNGLVEADSSRRGEAFVLRERLDLRLGHTLLRFINGRAAQPAERPMAPVSRSKVGWLEGFGWLLASLGISLLLDWLGQVGEVRSSALLTASLVGGVVMLAWSFGWALVTRLFAGEMRFLRHLRVVAIGSLLASMVMLLVQYLSYALAFEPLVRFAYVGYWLLFAMVCWRHLKVMGAGHPRAKALTVLGLALAAIGLQSLSLWQPRGGEQREARYVRTVVVPGFRLRPLEDVDSFLSRAATLESTLDAARSEDDEAAGSEPDSQ